jgi:hypothetical protein
VYKVEKLGKKTFVIDDMLRFLVMEMALFLELCYLTQKDMVATILFYFFATPNNGIRSRFVNFNRHYEGMVLEHDDFV